MLSADCKWLFGLAAHHPNSEIRAAMVDAMRRTAEPVRSGVWRPVIENRVTMRWNTTNQRVPEEASPEQAAFLRTYPVTRIMGVPVLDGARVLGGVSLVRFVTDRDFSEGGEGLLHDVAARAAQAIDFGALAHISPP